MDAKRLSEWLAEYKRSWEEQDPDTFVRLFNDQCEYRDNPFIEPVPAKEFHAFWSALAERQQDNHIEFEVLGHTADGRVIVNWRAVSTRRGSKEPREGNGIFVLKFDGAGLCSDLREWQHWHPVGAPLEKREYTWKRA